MLQPAVGRLLVSSPVLEDSNFARTVVLIGAHSDEGTFGVVVNRPLEAEPTVELADWIPLMAPPVTLFSGGPVSPESVLGLGTGGGGEGVIDDELAMMNLGEAPADDVGSVRLFVGHAGWKAGQLAGELASEAWFVVHRAPGDIFSAEPELLWGNVLRRQRGDLKLVSFYPRDLSSN